MFRGDTLRVMLLNAYAFGTLGTAWAIKAGDAVVDLGSPPQVVDAAGDSGDPIGGYSILQAESRQALTSVLDGHPHAAVGGAIEALEFLTMPGM